MKTSRQINYEKMLDLLASPESSPIATKTSVMQEEEEEEPPVVKMLTKQAGAVCEVETTAQACSSMRTKGLWVTGIIILWCLSLILLGPMIIRLPLLQGHEVLPF